MPNLYLPLLHRFHSPVADPAGTLILRPGTFCDYHTLARFHYRLARPATIARILTMHDPETDEPVAVLVISYPMLNAPWRVRIWPHLFRGDKRQRAVAANRHIRTISRIIVDPRWRGLGIASNLIRAYLSKPQTHCTEAIAAMARASPVFAAAGMMPIQIPTPRHTERLRCALASAALKPWQLLDPAAQQQIEENQQLTRTLRSWARATRAHRTFANAPIPILAQRAATALTQPSVIFAHDTAQSPMPNP